MATVFITLKHFSIFLVQDSKGVIDSILHVSIFIKFHFNGAYICIYCIFATTISGVWYIFPFFLQIKYLKVSCHIFVAVLGCWVITPLVRCIFMGTCSGPTSRVTRYHSPPNPFCNLNLSVTSLLHPFWYWWCTLTF